MKTDHTLEWMLFAGTVVFTLILVAASYFMPMNVVLAATLGTILGNFSGGLFVLVRQQTGSPPPPPPVQAPENPKGVTQ